MSEPGALPAAPDTTPQPGTLGGVVSERARPLVVVGGLFFYFAPLISFMTSAHDPLITAIGLLGWISFGLLFLGHFRTERQLSVTDPSVFLAIGIVLVVGLILTANSHESGSVMFYYAGIASARLSPNRAALGGIAAASVAAAVGHLLGGLDPADALAMGAVVGAISLTLYALYRLGQSYTELSLAREELARLAVANERNRIARDLHDTLGHSLSLIALKSELAGRLLPEQPARAREEIRDVERVAREALGAVRETVGGYRRPTLDGELEGARTVLAAAGIELQVREPSNPLPEPVDRAFAWVVREAVTNVVRHSGATHCRVIVDQAAGTARVEVTDDGRAVHGAPAVDGTGLTGVRERIGALGGRVEAKPLAGGGFQLTADLPLGQAHA